jgi:heme/copper-type cytochrome/quinol oxidase subunit 3
MSFPQPHATRRSVTGISTGKLAIWWIVGSEIVIFGGLLACYLMFRLHHSDTWSEEAVHTNIIAGSINTCILLSSSLSAVLAHHYAEHGESQKAFKFLWLTILGALGFVIVKSLEWNYEISHGFVITKNLFWVFYYMAAGLHGLHVIAGAIIMGIISIDVKKGKNLQRVEYIGIYWHFVDIVWIFLFPLLYIAK